MDSAKIFIDTDNEITFILEKILSAKTERVSLVIPDRASVLSSITGLKLIKRVVDKSGKLLVLVTLDSEGAELARNAGLFVVARVGEINEIIWEKIQKAKFEVIKKGVRPYYIPDKLPEEKKIESHAAPKLKDLVPQDIDKEEIDDEKANEELEAIVEDLEDDPVTDEKQDEQEEQAATPQIQIDIDVNDTTEIEEEADAPVAEAIDADTIQKIEEDYEVENIEAPEPSKLEETYEPEPVVDNGFRIRKVAPRSSGISNLSFNVGKDIGGKSEKKK